MKKITVAVVGFGDRSEIYTKFSLKNPDKMKIVAVVDPNEVRRNYAKQLFNIPLEYCFSNYDDFISKGKIADCVINGTMDNLHIKTTLPLLPLGYNVLLEKPITNNKEELLELQTQAEKYGNTIIICHVLRYAPFYKGIKKCVLDDDIGEIRHIETSENVGVAHASIAYIRGKWNNRKKCGSSYLLAKCCHDFDLICWLNNRTIPKIISSLGGRDYFIDKNAPVGSGTRCLVDCSVEKECPYSARKIHLDNNPMPITVWADIDKLPEEVTYEEREQSLRTTNVNGVCIFKTDADIVDQQMTMIKFANGSTAYHNLFSSTARAGRKIMIYGTKGEIEGFTEEKRFKIRTYNPENILYKEKTVNIEDDISNDNHSGGDSRLMEDFIKVLNGLEPSFSTSKLQDSVFSHLLVYAADESMEKEIVIKI